MSREANAKQQVATSPGVSHETFGRLVAYVEVLAQWQKTINLIAPSTLAEIWSRHILDSVQLLSLKPDARHWVDIGSGGGLPGLVIGCAMADYADAQVHLVESNAKKASFLRHVSVTLGLPVQVHLGRAEAVLPNLETPQVMTARALAALDDLLGYSNLLLKSGAVALFPKGRDYEDELTAATNNWHFKVTAHPSVTEKDARILEITMV